MTASSHFPHNLLIYTHMQLHTKHISCTVGQHSEEHTAAYTNICMTPNIHSGPFTHTLSHSHVQLDCFSKACLCKGSWILKLAAYFTFMKVGNGLAADMITLRSKQENALTFSYGSHYLHRFPPLFIFTSYSTLSHPSPLLFPFVLISLSFSQAVCV